MNIHHLELFYYVARHGGISEAVRRMPYGIQQPAVSSQLILLEKDLGVALFKRRPFALTPEGRELFAFVEPFFGGVEDVARRLRGGVNHHIRIGASEIVLQEHVPAVAQAIRHDFPGFRMTLREGYRSSVVGWLEKDEIDLGFTLLGGRLPAPLRAAALMDIPLALIVRARSPLREAGELWRRERIEEGLITLSPYEEVQRTFQQGLAERGIEWFPSIEVSSLNLVRTYVAQGYGIGLFLSVPGLPPPRGTRLLPLDGFPGMTFGAIWRGRPGPVVRAFLGGMIARARPLVGDRLLLSDAALERLLKADRT